MKPEPVWRAKVPAYPTRLQILADPAILERHVPPAWRATRDIASAVAVFLAANAAGCASGGKGSSGVTPSAAIVAPIFEHGEGRGATGCVVTSPPVFLSEEEALQVITEELSRCRIKMEQRNVEFNEVQVPSSDLLERITRQKLNENLALVEERIRSVEKQSDTDDSKDLGMLKNKLLRTRDKLLQLMKPSQKTLVVDAVDKTERIAVGFVSQKRYLDLGGTWDMSTVQEYDMREVATSLRTVIQNKGRSVYFGIFYDPVTYRDRKVISDYNKKLRETLDKDMRQEERSKLRNEYDKKVEEMAKNKSLDLLREQVKDFIDWLKAQGAI